MLKPKLLKKVARLVVLKTYSEIVNDSYDYDYSYDSGDYDGHYDLDKMNLSNVLKYAY